MFLQNKSHKKTLRQKKKIRGENTISYVLLYKMSSTTGRKLGAKKFDGKIKKKQRVTSAGLQRYLSTRGTPNGVHEFTRNVWFNVATNGTGMDPAAGGVYQAEFGMRFNLGSVTLTAANVSTQGLGFNFAELAALFDEIKLDKVEVTFRARQDSGAPSGAVTNWATQLATAIDYNDDSPISVSQLREYSTFKDNIMEPGGKEHKRIIRPKFVRLVSYTGGAGTNGYETAQGYLTPIDSIAHYGLKGYVVGPNGGSSLFISVKYFYKCKNTR